jgi:hypothetical protein
VLPPWGAPEQQPDPPRIGWRGAWWFVIAEVSGGLGVRSSRGQRRRDYSFSIKAEATGPVQRLTATLIYTDGVGLRGHLSVNKYPNSPALACTIAVDV